MFFSKKNPSRILKYVLGMFLLCMPWTKIKASVIITIQFKKIFNMSGVNPYIEQPEYKVSKQSYQIKFMPMGKTMNVNPVETLENHDGLPGSILQLALENDIDLDHSCGGVCACSTCHVIVHSGLESCECPPA